MSQVPNQLKSSAIRPALLLGAILLLPAGLALAQLPVARLDSVFPPGGRAGTEVEVSLGGADLDDATTLLFSREGLVSRPSGPGRFIVTLATNTPPGDCDLRVVGRFGVSNPRVFAVGDRPEIPDPGTNATPAAALSIPPDAWVSGRIAPAGSDYFRFTARAGEHLTVECRAPDIDSRLDPSLWILNDQGRDVARSRRGGVLDYTVPGDGVYLLRVHDFLNRGGDDYFYRLRISRGPHIRFVQPLAVEVGTNSGHAVTVFGRNLPGGTTVTNGGSGVRGLESLQVMIAPPPTDPGVAPLRLSRRVTPPGAGLDAVELRVGSTNGTSNPATVSLTPWPVRGEQEPNGEPAKSQKLSLPCDVSGSFEGWNDHDWYAFDAHKGDLWQIEIFSHRLGFHCDPSLHLQRVSRGSKGEEQVADVMESYDIEGSLGGPEFKTTTGDAALRLEVKEDATYRLLVRDQGSASAHDETRGYRLAIHPQAPDFRLVALPLPPPPTAKDSKEARLTSPFLRAGGVVPLQVHVFRLDGYGGPVELAAEGLPPGVTSAGAVIPADARSGLLLLKADDRVTNWAGSIRVVGRAKVGAADRVREARGATVIWATGNYDAEAVASRVSHNIALAVSGDEPAPLSLELAGGKAVEVAVGGKLSLPVRLTKRGEFGGNLKLRLTGDPALGAGRELDVDKAATNAVFELDLGQVKLPEGEHLLHVETQTSFQAPRSVKGLQDAEAAVKAAADKEKAAAQERVKQYARREFNDVFYSAPIRVKVVASKPSEKPKS
jgi:hypothetical protein